MICKHFVRCRRFLLLGEEGEGRGEGKDHSALRRTLLVTARGEAKEALGD